ncbi:MAG: DNA replication/repair protein RecF [Leucobacter sp.]|nr:DNA replication/repair protein RecF [Leucobacter sp.]
MRVIHLSLADFRNYAEAEAAFAPGRNLVVGRNGQGKTNLVEAIAYFASLHSHRVSADAALIRAGMDTAVARMRVGVNDREALLELEFNRHAPNRARINRNAQRPRELMRWFSAIVFAPEDLMIVRGDPAGRRRFLDEALVARTPSLAGVLSDYDRVVRQRTALLKSARANRAGSAVNATLGVWDEQLTALGSRIMFERRALLGALSTPLQQAYHSLVEVDHEPRLILQETVAQALGGGPADVSRETGGVELDPRNGATEGGPAAGDAVDGDGASSSDVSRETLERDFRAALAAVRSQELERAVTLVGPHRDDVLFALNGLPVKGYASHGESWSFALSLRLAVAELLRHESPAGDPVMILDDVFAELDTERRARLMEAVDTYEQVIVTAAVEADVPRDREWHTIRIAAGTVVDPHEPGSFGPGGGHDAVDGAAVPRSGADDS